MFFSRAWIPPEFQKLLEILNIHCCNTERVDWVSHILVIYKIVVSHVVVSSLLNITTTSAAHILTSISRGLIFLSPLAPFGEGEFLEVVVPGAFSRWRIIHLHNSIISSELKRSFLRTTLNFLKSRAMFFISCIISSEVEVSSSIIKFEFSTSLVAYILLKHISAISLDGEQRISLI